MIAPTIEGARLRTLDPSLQFDTGTGYIPMNGMIHRVDHVAQAVPSMAILEDLVGRFDALGAEVVEEPYVFPDDHCDVEVDWALKKVLATVRLSDDGLLVLGASCHPGDQIDNHLRRWGTGVPHHIALAVANVTSSVASFARLGFRVGPITDDGELAQVFMGTPSGQIVELITRQPSSNSTFTCANVAALSAAERTLQEGNER